ALLRPRPRGLQPRRHVVGHRRVLHPARGRGRGQKDRALPHRRRYVLHWRRRIGRGRHRFDPRRGGRHHRDRTRSHTRRRPDLGRGHGRPKEGRVLLMTTPPPTTEATAGFSPTRPKTLLRFATA